MLKKSGNEKWFFVVIWPWINSEHEKDTENGNIWIPKCVIKRNSSNLNMMYYSMPPYYYVFFKVCIEWSIEGC